jgi:hypothetical protein
MVFDRLVDEPQTVNIRDFASAVYPHSNPSAIRATYPPGDVLFGRTDDFVVTLEEHELTSRISAYHELFQAVVVPSQQKAAIGGLIAGNIIGSDEVPILGLVQPYEDLWLFANGAMYDSGNLAKASAGFSFLSRIALLGQEILDSGQVLPR